MINSSLSYALPSKKPKKVWNSRFSWSDIPIYLCFIVFALITIYPFWYVLVGSFNTGSDYLKGGIFIWPREFTFANFEYVLLDLRLYKAFGVTIARTILTTSLSTIFTAMIAYSMSIHGTPGRKIAYWINIFTMFFGGGLIPYFLLLVNLGFYNSFFVYVIPGMYSVFNMLIFSNFFSGISKDYRESALIDGASEFTIIFRIYFPISKAVFATVALWTAVGCWNSYYDTMLYTSDANLWTLQYYLMTIVKQLNLPPEIMGGRTFGDEISAQTVSNAAIIISSVIILCFYPLISKTFKKGQMMGAIK